MENQEPIYVVRTDYNEAIQCKNAEEAQNVIDWVQNHSPEFVCCKSITEDQLLADYSKPASVYQTEAEALDDDYIWDDYLSVWLYVDIIPYDAWNADF